MLNRRLQLGIQAPAWRLSHRAGHLLAVQSLSLPGDYSLRHRGHVTLGLRSLFWLRYFSAVRASVEPVFSGS